MSSGVPARLGSKSVRYAVQLLRLEVYLCISSGVPGFILKLLHVTYSKGGQVVAGVRLEFGVRLHHMPGCPDPELLYLYPYIQSTTLQARRPTTAY